MPGRSSTARSADDLFCRRAPRGLRSRADLPRPADRSVDLMRASRCRPRTRKDLRPVQKGRRDPRDDQARPRCKQRAVRSVQGLAPIASEGAAGPASGDGNAGGARTAGQAGPRGVRAFAGGGAACASGAGNAVSGRPRLLRMSFLVEGFGDRSRPALARAGEGAPASGGRAVRGRVVTGGAAAPAGSRSWSTSSRNLPDRRHASQPQRIPVATFCISTMILSSRRRP